MWACVMMTHQAQRLEWRRLPVALPQLGITLKQSAVDQHRFAFVLKIRYFEPVTVPTPP
jgi:uncharacterized lipoprotein